MPDEIPPITEAKDAPAYYIARVLFPDFYGQGTGEVIAESPLRWALEAAAAIQAVFSLPSAGIEPNMRETTQRANHLVPNEIPGPSDLVRFELREVFREADRADQLAEPPSEAFLEAMRRQGYDKFWAESYWAAHWDLPSVQQAFEMFQRLRPGKVAPELAFTEADLRKFLKKQDVLSEYRDRLTAIAYNPLTRVDIRRMYHMRVLSYDEMVEAYRDIGYDQANALKLSDFTKKDYDPDDKDLTLSQLVLAYQNDVLAYEALRDAVDSLGYPDKAQEILLSTQKAIKEKKAASESAALARKLQTIKLTTRRQSRSGKLDEELLRLQLSDLGMSQVDIEDFVAKNTVAPHDKAADLSRSDVLAALRKGVMSRDAATSQLHALGYDSEETLILVETALKQKAAHAPKTKQRDLSLAQIRSALVGGTITAEDAKARLLSQGYDEAEAAILLAGYTSS